MVECIKTTPVGNSHTQKVPCCLVLPYLLYIKHDFHQKIVMQFAVGVNTIIGSCFNWGNLVVSYQTEVGISEACVLSEYCWFNFSHYLT